MKKAILLSLLSSVLLLSCLKEDRIRSKYAGPKKISKYRFEKISETGEVLQTLYDTTNIAEMILWNSNSDVFNDVTFTKGNLPAGWNYANIGTGVSLGGYLGWYMDFEKQNTFTFWAHGSDGNDYRQTYTLTKHTRNSLEMEAVYLTGQGLFHEVMTIDDL